MGARSVITSQAASFFDELAAGHAGTPIPDEKLVYFRTRSRNRLYHFILSRFVAEQEKGLTKAALARRIGKSPEVINRWLGSPSNLTADSISDLLIGISGEELAPTSEPILNQRPGNYRPWDDNIKIQTDTKPSTETAKLRLTV
jgi:hypothetical protein